MLRKLAAVCVIWILLCVLCTGAALAEGELSGGCGSLTWALTPTGDVLPYGENLPTYDLTVSGRGAVPDYRNANEAPWFAAVQNKQQIASITLADGVTDVGDNAFWGCSGATEIVLPGSLRTIGDYAFWSSRGGKDLVIPHGVTRIGNSAFGLCGMESVSLPGTLTELEERAFFRCNGLKKVNLPGSLKVLNRSVFQDCRALESISFSQGLETVANDAFRGCTSLRSLSLPRGMKVIMDRAFSETGLTRVVMPDDIWMIATDAFTHCTLIFTGTEATAIVPHDTNPAVGLVVYYPRNARNLDAVMQRVQGQDITFHTYAPGQLPASGGWEQRDGLWYYLDDAGDPVKGWQQIDGTWYYFDTAGVMQTGWLQLDGLWYYFDASGAMRTGWLQNGGWYYLDPSGAMRTGWLQDGGTWYFLESSGRMKTGWALIAGEWYYFSCGGAMQTGWLLSGGQWYYLMADGSMQTDGVVDGWIIGADGVATPG